MAAMFISQKNGNDAGVWFLVMEDTGAFSPQKDLSHPWRARKQQRTPFMQKQSVTKDFILGIYLLVQPESQNGGQCQTEAEGLEGQTTHRYGGFFLGC